LSEQRLWWRWLIEWQTPYEGHAFAVKRVLYSGRTKYQQVDIVELYGYGKCLFLDGKLQSSLSDEWIYHEALVHPAMLTHPEPRRVLIVGGGEGATLREVLKHDCVEEVFMVDLDEEVVKLCMKYLPEWHRGSFEDPRVRLFFKDGREFLSECHRTFDVVIVDLTDPVPSTPSVRLYTREFYEAVKSRLSEDGVMVTQATSVHYSRKNFAIICSTLRSVFPIVRPYSAYVPSFVTPWGFALASNKHDPLSLTESEIERRLSKVSGELLFYEPRIHAALFTLPRYLLELIENERSVATDEKPIYMPA